MQPNPESVIRRGDGRALALKAHRCLWSGDYIENSLPAIEECLREGVARAEIDLHPLRGGDFLVLHDETIDAATTGTGRTDALSPREAESVRLRGKDGVSSERPPFFSEVAARIQAAPSPTIVELDLGRIEPLPWPRIEELAALAQPIKDHVLFNGCDWNMRRLVAVDERLPVAYDLYPHLDWLPHGDPDEDELGMPRGAYGYLDAHPLARRRYTTTPEYLIDRLGALVRLVPGAREIHLRLATFERMRDDGLEDVAGFFHRHGLLLDVWTLNADAPRWRERLADLLAAGVDTITSDTPRALHSATIKL